MTGHNGARRTAFAVIALLVFVGACTGSPSPTSTRSPTASPPSSSATPVEDTLPPGVSPPPSGLTPPSFEIPPPSGLEPPPSGVQAPTGTDPAGGGGVQTARHADAALEAMLPASVGGVALSTHSLAADDLIGPANEAQIDSFLDAVGRTRGDLTFAGGFDPTGQLAGSIGALRVAGAEPATLLESFLAVQSQVANAPSLQELSVGGRTVSAATFQAESGAVTQYFLSQGDVVFSVTATDPATAALFLEALP